MATLPETDQTTPALVLGERVLIVEDDPATRVGLSELVGAWGFQTEAAANGEEALQKVQATAPFLVLMDVNMPGMGGLAATEQVRTLAPATHVTLLTANVQDATRRRAQELGAGFIEKPISEARIHQLLVELGA